MKISGLEYLDLNYHNDPKHLDTLESWIAYQKKVRRERIFVVFSYTVGVIMMTLAVIEFLS